MEVSEMNALIESLIAMSGDKNVIVVRKPFVKFMDSLEAGMMLNQLLYWTPRGTLRHDWIAKSDDDFSKELCLTKYALRKARAVLEAKNILETTVRKFAGTPVVHYRMKLDAFCEAWVAWLGTQLVEEGPLQPPPPQPNFVKTQSGLCENAKSSTETTTETTEDLIHKTQNFTLANPESEIAETGILPSEKEKNNGRANEQSKEEFDALFSAGQVRSPAAHRAPSRTAAQIQEDTRAASARGWARSAGKAFHAGFEEVLLGHGDKAPALRELHELIETNFGLAPNWESVSQVKRWVDGLSELHTATNGDTSITIAAGTKLRKDRMTMATPHSLVRTAQSMAAERATAWSSPASIARKEYV